MKRFNFICLLVVSMAAFAPTVKADNPVSWDFYLETYGARDNDGPLSPPIDLGYPEHNYNWVITNAYLRVMGNWYAGPIGLNGNGSIGSVPFSDILVYHHSSSEIDFDILASVDNSGYGTVSIDNITFGQAQGYDVTGIRFNGNVMVEGVPEPATVCLLGLGVLGLLHRRR